MRVLVSGATGLVGSALVLALKADGHSALTLVRRPPREASEIEWHPDRPLDPTAVDQARGFDAVVHLAGENIAGRWTAAKKARIRASRVEGTRNLAEGLSRLSRKPAVLISASAVGYYGDRGDALLGENDPPGTGFLAGACVEWEAATSAAAQAGIRVVNLRIGLILSPRGGALPRMLPPFRLGIAGVMATGRQWMSWIALDDVVGVIRHAIQQPALHGPVNTVAPGPVTNHEFTKTLGRVLSRPTVFPMPTFAVKLIFGEMGEELLLASQRVQAARLTASGYRFLHPQLEGALRALLGKA